MKKVINLILLGEPGAGKATQAQLLLKKYKFYDLDMGKELRKLEKNNPDVKGLLNKTLDKGKLSPTKLVRAIFKEKIESVPSQKGILFDGNPKMLGEAQLVKKLLKQHKRSDPLVLYIVIPFAETVRRVSHRTEYSRGQWTHREDDTIEALKNRTRYYRKNIAEVVDFFKTSYSFKRVDGVGTVQEVHDRIVAAIEQFIHKHE